MKKIEKMPAKKNNIDGLRKAAAGNGIINLKESGAVEVPTSEQPLRAGGWQNLGRKNVYELLTAAFGDNKEAAEYLKRSFRSHKAFKEKTDKQAIEEAIKIFVDTFWRETKTNPKLKQSEALPDFLQDLSQRLRFVLAGKKINPEQRDQAVKELIFRISQKIKIPATSDSPAPPSQPRELKNKEESETKDTQGLVENKKNKSKRAKKSKKTGKESDKAPSRPEPPKTKISPKPTKIKPEIKEAKKPTDKEDKKELEDKDKKESVDKEVKIKFSDEVLKRAETFGLKEDDLAQIKGFDELSAGQQLLALKNLGQITLGRIQEQASRKYKENLRQKGALARIWQEISKAYQIAKLEKLTAAEIVAGGLKAHQELLEQLTKGLKEFGPQAAIKKDKLIIQYADLPEAGPEQLKILESFNNAAAKFSQIPYEWSLATANRKEKKQYQQALKQYEKDKAEFLKAAAEKIGEKQAASYLNEIEYKIKMNQFLTANPDLEEDGIAKIKDRKIWRQAIKNVATERGIYMLGGSITRAATVSLLGTIGAPVGAAIAGGILAGKRAKDELVAADKAARRGDESNNIIVRKYSKVAKASAKVNKLIEKINIQIDKIKTENLSKKDLQHIEQKLSAYQKALKINVDWIEGKLDRGLINFGPEKQRLVRQYNLVKTLAKGEIYLSEFQLGKRIKNRIDKAITEQELDETAKRRAYLQDKMIRGATISALFAAAGELLAHYVGWDEKVAHNFTKNKNKLTSTLQRQPAPKPPTGGAKAVDSHIAAAGGQKHIIANQQPQSSPPSQPSGSPASAVEPKIAASLGNKQELAQNLAPIHIKISKGDSIWTIAKKYLDKRFGEQLSQVAGGNSQKLEALRVYNVDHLKDVIMKEPQKFGLSKHFDPTKLSIQDLRKVDLDKAFNEAFSGQKPKINLSADKIQSILEQKQHLSDYFHTHPAAPRTEQGYRAAEAAISTAKTAQTPTASQNIVLPTVTAKTAAKAAWTPTGHKQTASQTAIDAKFSGGHKTKIKSVQRLQTDRPASQAVLTNKTPASTDKAVSQNLIGQNLGAGAETVSLHQLPIEKLARQLNISSKTVEALKNIMDNNHLAVPEKVENLLEAIGQGQISIKNAAKYYALHFKPSDFAQIDKTEVYKAFNKVLVDIMQKGNRSKIKYLADLIGSMSK